MKACGEKTKYASVSIEAHSNNSCCPKNGLAERVPHDEYINKYFV
jgi:hypothetical protein